jgi:hypothetical protein
MRRRLQSCDTKSPLPETSGLQVNALMKASGEPAQGGPPQANLHNHYAKEKIMNKLNKIATAVALSLGVAATAYAHPGQMGGGMGSGMQQGGQHQMQGQMMGQGRMQGMNHGGKQAAMGGNRGEGCDAANTPGTRPQAGQQLMTPEERTAMQDKMRSAKTPEERQQIAMANRAEMQKRATEKGITLPEHSGPHGRGPATTR